MTNEQHPGDVPAHDGAVDQHSPADHGDGTEHDDHADAEEPLGPIDVPAWGAGVVGVLLGLAVTLAFWMATLPTEPPV